MKDSQKFQNIEINPIHDYANVLNSIRYVVKRYTIGVKFGKSRKRLIPGL